jgi:hypothetical protein
MVPTGATTNATPAVPKRRGAWLAIGTLAVTGMIAAAVVLAAHQRSGSAPRLPPVAKRAEQAVLDAQALDATLEVAAVPDAASPPDAPAVQTSAPHPQAQLRTRPDVAKLVAEAEDARRAGNLLGQVQKADEALSVDPRNVRARFLLADGLIASGDLDRGCKYLRDLGKNPTAQARARQAGCPTN